jgi:NAD(P)H-flavin reductase
MITVPVRQITHANPTNPPSESRSARCSIPFAAGQAVMIGLSGSPLRKPYSIGSAPWEVTKSGIMQVLVQVED